MFWTHQRIMRATLDSAGIASATVVFMIRSELADELKVSPSVVRKWLTVYASLTGRTITSRLDQQTADDMRRARLLTLDHPGMTFREALERTLGLYNEPVPPASVEKLTVRLDRLDVGLSGLVERQGAMEAGHTELLQTLGAIREDLQELLGRPRGPGRALFPGAVGHGAEGPAAGEPGRSG